MLPGAFPSMKPAVPGESPVHAPTGISMKISAADAAARVYFAAFISCTSCIRLLMPIFE